MDLTKVTQMVEELTEPETVDTVQTEEPAEQMSAPETVEPEESKAPDTPDSEEPVDDPDLEYEDDYVEDVPERRGIRAEFVLGAIALLALALLVGVIVMSLPFFFPAAPQTAADPDAVLHQSHAEEESELKAEPILEETEPAETTEPTIPPERNPYNQYDFQYGRHNYLHCLRQDSYPGVDVSAFQGQIDWQQVARSGIRFAMIRLGYRGYGKAGKMVEDEYAQANLKGAAEAGLERGAYFFSQATSIQEVDEEINFMLEILGDNELTMPIVLDWETVSDEGRTVGVDRRTLTECLKYFCQIMTEKGFQPMVYFNWGQAARMIHLNELEDYPFWLALYQDRMTFPYRVEMWQYTSTGRVPGINGDVDINVYIPDMRAKQ